MANINCNTPKDKTEALNQEPVVPNATIQAVPGCGLPQGKIRVELTLNGALTAIPAGTATGDNAALINALIVTVNQLRNALN